MGGKVHLRLKSAFQSFLNRRRDTVGYRRLPALL
jgi:hypothetical protein